MTRAPGRDQRGPMERLTVILFVLSQAGETGCPAQRLTDLGLYGGEPEGQREQLARDIGHLCALGWEIDNVAPRGTDAVYRLVARDNRLRLEFTPEERVELYRCARMAHLRALEDGLRPDVRWPQASEEFEIDDPSPLPGLEEVLAAVSQQRRLSFRYFGRDRDVLPTVAYDRSGAWYVVAVDSGVQKTFRVDRMSDVRLGDLVSTALGSPPRRPRLDPLTWERDDWVEAVVSTTREHRPRVVAMLGTPVADEVDGDRVRLTIPTTNRTAFLHRLCQLRERVRLEGPEDLRDRLRTHLLAVVGEAP